MLQLRPRFWLCFLFCFMCMRKRINAIGLQLIIHAFVCLAACPSRTKVFGFTSLYVTFVQHHMLNLIIQPLYLEQKDTWSDSPRALGLQVCKSCDGDCGAYSLQMGPTSGYLEPHCWESGTDLGLLRSCPRPRALVRVARRESKFNEL